MAKLTAQEIKDNINADITDNVNGLVSPEDISSNLIDIIDSVDNLIDDPTNFSITAIRNTRGGEDALDSSHLESYDTEDNTAYGYHSMYSTFTGTMNTAAGAFSLNCNVYGSGNAAFGYSALGKNLRGNNNVGVGKNSLHHNQNGDNNIGIGNAAGYFIDPNDNHKLYIASHDIDSSGVCVNPSGRLEDIPLIHGDLLNPKLGVNTKTLNNQGTLQVDGSVTPVDNSYTDTLGTTTYGWGNAYLNKITPQSELSIDGDLVPNINEGSSLGTNTKNWDSLYVKDIFVAGTQQILNTEITYATFTQFPDKVFYIASSGINEGNGGPGAYLTDEGLNNAGFAVQSSGFDYTRTYSILFSSPDTTIGFLDEDSVFSRSHWESNISLSVESGRHVRTNRILGRETLDLLASISGVGGVHIGPACVFSTDEDRDTFYNQWDNGNLSGVMNVTHVAPSGKDLINNLIADSGNKIEQGWYTRHSGTNNDLTGFRTFYEDTNSQVDRLITVAQKPGGQAGGAFIINRDNASVGITREDSLSFVPNALLNVNTSGEADVRINAGTEARIELTVDDNDASEGVEIAFSGDKGWFRTIESGVKADLLSMSGDRLNVEKALSFTEYPSGETPENELNKVNLYTKRIDTLDRTHSIFFQDESGVVHDLIQSGLLNDIADPEFVYYDVSGNTFVGLDSPNDRAQIDGSRNTALGDSSLFTIDYGNSNISIGYSSGSGISNGSRNILIGNKAGGGQDLDNHFYLGHSENGEQPLMSGRFPDNADVGKLYVNNHIEVTNADQDLAIQFYYDSNNAVIEQNDKLDVGSTSGNNMYLRFGGTLGWQDIVKVYPRGIFLSNGNYYEEPIDRSSVELRADLDLLGAIHFSDGTRLDSFTEYTPSGGTGIDVSRVGTTDVVAFDISSFNDAVSYDDNSTLLISTSGNVGEVSAADLRSLLYTENPQLYFSSYLPNQYNLVISESTNVSHDDNSSVIFVGRNAGDASTGFTNSIIIGLDAGRNASVNGNPGGTLDVATVFVGYKAGENSSNADNSVFMGTSCGKDSVNCDKSVFIGNSAGSNSRSSKSVGIGDDSLNAVVGTNNVEIIGEKRTDRTYLQGTQNNKINLGGLFAGDMSTGRVRLGGGQNLNPNAVVEVRPESTDTNRLLELYDRNGQLAAYIDQDGNLGLKGAVLENAL